MTKPELLEYLAEVGSTDAHDLAGVFEILYPAAAMALLRLTRQGLLRRFADAGHPLYIYELTDRGHERLAFFRRRDRDGEESQVSRNPRPLQREVSHPTIYQQPGRGAHAKELATMKRKKIHNGTYHCPRCFIEFDLFAEESLKCDQCQGPLAAGTLDQVWSNADDDQD